MNVEEYVERYLADELQIIKQLSSVPTVQINIYEQTIIYKYSADGYQDLNASLRKEPNVPPTEYGRLLAETISKLPPCHDIVYRAVNLTSKELSRYKKVGETIVEPFFVSTSRKKLIADKYGTTLFRIISKSGRDISAFSKHREAEVLFVRDTTFRVQKVDEQYDGRVVITLKET